MVQELRDLRRRSTYHCILQYNAVRPASPHWYSTPSLSRQSLCALRQSAHSSSSTPSANGTDM